MAEKIKIFLKNEKAVSKLIFYGLMLGVVSLIVGPRTLAYFQRIGTPSTGWQYGYGYGGEYGYGYGYGYGSGDNASWYNYGYLQDHAYPTSMLTAIGPTTATITVNTSYLSKAQVVVVDPDNEESRVESGYTNTFATSTNISLNNFLLLSPNTTYSFYAQAKDIAGQEYTEQTQHNFTTLANVPTGLAATAVSQNQITISWDRNSNPTDTEYFAENFTTGTNSGWTTSTSWTSSGLNCGTEYSFRVKARNREQIGTTYASTTISTMACSGSGGTGGGGAGGGGGISSGITSGQIQTPVPEITPIFPIPTPVIVPIPGIVQNPADVKSILTILNLKRDQVAEAKYLPMISLDAKAFGIKLTREQLFAATNFVTYGISEATQKLGAGERRALLRDYWETVGRAEIVWSDIERLATGQKVLGRNLVKEQSQLPKVLAAFVRLVGHRPNFKNAKEDLAWNTMMYRLRFTRDLNKERIGIAKFKAVFKRLPKTPLDWAVVRAWGYALQ
jgi:hypothetical protein